MSSPAGSAAPPPELPYTYRPRTSTGVVLLAGAAVSATFAVVAVKLPGAGDTSDVLQRIGIAAASLPIMAVLVLIGRPLLRAEAGGLVVRNLVRTRRLEWAEVVAVRFGPGDPWVLLDLASGDTLAVMAVQSADGARARRAAVRLARLVEEQTRTERDS